VIHVRFPARLVPFVLAVPAALAGIVGAYHESPWRTGGGCLVALTLLAVAARHWPVRAGLLLLAAAVVPTVHSPR
jgi:hypothetical protein